MVIAFLSMAAGGVAAWLLVETGLSFLFAWLIPTFLGFYVGTYGFTSQPENTGYSISFWVMVGAMFPVFQRALG